MKKVINSFRIFSVCALLAIIGQSFTTPSVSSPCDDSVIVPQGTPVLLRLNENINSNEVETGTPILFEVANPVIVNGIEVVAQGTMAEGEVTYINRNDDCNECADGYHRIEIKVTKVKAVDGSFLWLYGKPLVVKSKCLNCPAQIRQGISLSATVQNTKVVKV